MDKITSDDQALSLLPQKDISVWDQYGDSYDFFNKYNYVLRYLTIYKVTQAELGEVQKKADQNNDAINFINSTNTTRDKQIKGLSKGIEDNVQKITKNIRDIGYLKNNAIDKSDLSDINKELDTQEKLIGNKADKGSVTEIKNQVNGFSTQIAGKVDKTTYDVDMSSINSKFDGVNNSIKDITPTVQKEIENNLKGHVLDVSAGSVNDNDDFNIYTTQGIYTILAPQNLKNAPEDNLNWARLVVLDYGGNGVYQLVLVGLRSYIRSYSGANPSWSDWEPFGGDNVVNTTSDQIISGQKVFSQNPETVNGDTMYPASSTGWIHNTGLKLGPHVDDADYNYRIDRINGNPTMYIHGALKLNPAIESVPWGDKGRAIFTLPSKENKVVFKRFYCTYSGDVNIAPCVFRDLNVSSDQTVNIMLDNIRGGTTMDYNKHIEIFWTVPLTKY